MVPLALTTVPPMAKFISHSWLSLCLSRLNTKRSMKSKRQSPRNYRLEAAALPSSCQDEQWGKNLFYSSTPHLGLCCCESFSQPASPETVIFPLPLVISFLAYGKCFLPYLGQRLLFFKVDEKCVVPKGDRHLLFVVQGAGPHLFTLKCLLNNYTAQHTWDTRLQEETNTYLVPLMEFNYVGSCG